MKGKVFKKGFALGLVITMLGMQCVVMESKPVQAAGNRKSINLGTSVLSTDGYTDGYWTEEEGIKVYLGQATQGDDTSNVLPMPYRVLNSDGTTQVFLDGDTVISHQNLTASEAHHWLRTAVTTGNKRASVYTGGALDAYDANNV